MTIYQFQVHGIVFVTCATEMNMWDMNTGHVIVIDVHAKFIKLYFFMSLISRITESKQKQHLQHLLIARK